MRGIERVSDSTADMGGIRMTSANNASIVQDNIFINIDVLEARLTVGARRFLTSTSTCVYTRYSRHDAWTADSGPRLSIESLFTEELYQHSGEDHCLETHVIHFRDIYGPLGSTEIEKEKVPAAVRGKIDLPEGSSKINVRATANRLGPSTTSLIAWAGAIASRASTRIGVPIWASITSRQVMDLGALVPSPPAWSPVIVMSSPNRKAWGRGEADDGLRLREQLGSTVRAPIANGPGTNHTWVSNQARADGSPITASPDHPLGYRAG